MNIRGVQFTIKRGVSALEEQFFGLVDLGGQVGRAAVVGVVVEHERAVLGFDDCDAGSLAHSEDELRLPAVHGRVEAAGVHAERVEVFLVANMAVELDCSAHSCLRGELHRPATISHTPITVLIAHN